MPLHAVVKSPPWGNCIRTYLNFIMFPFTRQGFQFLFFVSNYTIGSRAGQYPAQATQTRRRKDPGRSWRATLGQKSTIRRKKRVIHSFRVKIAGDAMPKTEYTQFQADYTKEERKPITKALLDLSSTLGEAFKNKEPRQK